MHASRGPLWLAWILLSIAPLVHSDVRDDPWLRLTAPNIELITNLEPAAAETLFDEIQQFKPIAARFIPARSRRAPPLKMLAFKSRGDFVKVTKPRHFAAFTQPELRHTLLVIAPTGGDESLLQHARHEYAHYRLRSAKVSYPLWYEEGMATLLGSSDVTRRQEVLRVRTRATPNLLMDRPFVEREAIPLSLDDVMRTRRVDGWPYWRLVEFYRKSAQLVHFLTFGQERGLPDRRAGLARHFGNRGESVYAALDVPPARLRREFARYVRSSSRRPQLLQIPIERSATRPLVEEIPRANVLEVLALAAEESNPKQALRYLAELAELQPDNAEPLVELSRLHGFAGDLDAAHAYLERAQGLAGDSASVLIQEATLAIRGCWSKADACLDDWRRAADLSRQALEVDASRFDGIHLLGIAELYTGHPGQALNYLRIAYERAPWSPRLNFHYGECLRLLGDPRASGYLANARDWAESDTWRELALASLSQL